MGGRLDPAAPRAAPGGADLRPRGRAGAHGRLVRPADVEAIGVLPAGPDEVFAFLSALERHWAMAGRWIEVVSLAHPPLATGAVVRMRGPLGLRRTAVTRVERVEPP